jgi:hypothetical protein
MSEDIRALREFEDYLKKHHHGPLDAHGKALAELMLVHRFSFPEIEGRLADSH